MPTEEWPHGIVCARCNRNIENEVKMGLPSTDAPDQPDEVPVRVLVCAECWTDGGEDAE